MNVVYDFDIQNQIPKISDIEDGYVVFLAIKGGVRPQFNLPAEYTVGSGKSAKTYNSGETFTALGHGATPEKEQPRPLNWGGVRQRKVKKGTTLFDYLANSPHCANSESYHKMVGFTEADAAEGAKCPTKGASFIMIDPEVTTKKSVARTSYIRKAVSLISKLIGDIEGEEVKLVKGGSTVLNDVSYIVNKAELPTQLEKLATLYELATDPARAKEIVETLEAEDTATEKLYAELKDYGIIVEKGFDRQFDGTSIGGQSTVIEKLKSEDPEHKALQKALLSALKKAKKK